MSKIFFNTHVEWALMKRHVHITKRSMCQYEPKKRENQNKTNVCKIYALGLIDKRVNVKFNG